MKRIELTNFQGVGEPLMSLETGEEIDPRIVVEVVEEFNLDGMTTEYRYFAIIRD